jgi:PPE-repeat protein
MDFAFLTPEINSARMYSGPGPGALLMAAGSWDSLSAELGTTAQIYESVLWGLTSLQWRGPTAAAMAATAAPYTGWLHTTAEQAMQTATQARAAAAAFELAYAMTVPPAAIAANRAHLAALIATNFFGQNTAAIASTEAQYAEYWAQDAAAMYGYAANSAAATQLTPFSSPRPTSNSDGLTAQHAAVTRAVNNAAASKTLSQTGSGSQTSASNPLVPDDFSITDGAVALFSSTDNVANLEAFPEEIIGASNSAGILPATAAATAEVAPAARLAGLAPSIGGAAGLGDVTLTAGRAGSIGSMSVPASWTTPPNTPFAEPVTSLRGNVFGNVTETGPLGEPGSATPGPPGMRPPSRPTLVVPRYGVRVTVVPRPPCAG